MENEKVNNEFLKIVYNGQPVTLNEETATMLAQKGMNYDKLYEKYEKLMGELKESLEYKQRIEEIAKELNIPVKDVLSGLNDESEKVSIAEYSLRNNIPLEYAKSFKEMEKKISLLEKEKEELVPLKKRQEELKEFKKIHPDIDEKNIDPEIIKKWEESGRPLNDVYNEITLNKLLKENEAKKANEENMMASAGSVSGIPDKEEEYTDDIIRKMSDSEFNRNFEKILKHYKKGEK